MGPNKCMCQPPYFGDLCDEIKCEKDLETLCLNGGIFDLIQDFVYTKTSL